MLIQYSVENYKSIKNEITINFSVDKKYQNDSWSIKSENRPPLYKCMGLIGPNASGKANIIRSFLFALRFIYHIIEHRENSKIKIDRFRFDESCLQKPAFLNSYFITRTSNMYMDFLSMKTR